MCCCCCRALRIRIKSGAWAGDRLVGLVRSSRTDRPRLDYQLALLLLLILCRELNHRVKENETCDHLNIFRHPGGRPGDSSATGRSESTGTGTELESRYERIVLQI